MLNRPTGFSLIELLLALTLTTLTIAAALAVHGRLWATTWQQQQASEARQGFYALGHWLHRELQAELTVNPMGESHLNASANTWSFDVSQRCLLYTTSSGSVNGIRLRQNAVQWKPESGDCASAGWLNLHDPTLFAVLDFSLVMLEAGQLQLCLMPAQASAIERGQTGQAAAPWCYSWWGRH